MQRYSMAKPPIEYRPSKTAMPLMVREAFEMLEAYKAAERAKVLKRVKKHRAKLKASK